MYVSDRIPNTSDVHWPIGQFWLYQAGSANTRLWYLLSLSQSSEVVTANWQPIDSDANDFIPDTGTSPITGNVITFTNTSILATGTLANALRSNGTGASTIAYQTQYAGSNAATSAASKWGVAQFDSNQFTVTSGYVQLNSGTGFTWTDEGAPFNAAVSNGYFVTAATTGTLPASPSQGNEIKFVSDVAGVVTIQAVGTQKIRIGNVLSSAAGTAVSTAIGDSLSLVYRAADTTWYSTTVVGVWGVT